MDHVDSARAAPLVHVSLSLVVSSPGVLVIVPIQVLHRSFALLTNLRKSTKSRSGRRITGVMLRRCVGEGTLTDVVI